MVGKWEEDKMEGRTKGQEQEVKKEKEDEVEENLIKVAEDNGIQRDFLIFRLVSRFTSTKYVCRLLRVESFD